MSVTAKSLQIHTECMDKVKIQVAATLPVATDSFDSNGFAVTTLSADATPATGEKVIVVRTNVIGATGAKDIFGNTAADYSHHVIQFCTEKNYESTTDNVLDILAPAELLPLICEAARVGCYVEWYRSANGTVPATAQMTAANLAATWRPLYWNVSKAV